MARVHYVKKAQARYERVPLLDDQGQPVLTPVMRRDGTQKTTRKGKPVFVRPTVNDLSRPKPNLECGKCGVEIAPGDPYKWVQPKSSVYGGSKRYRCTACPTWRPSELTSSKMAGVYAAQEQCDDQVYGCEDVDALEALRDDLADQIEQVGDEYEEAAQNIIDGFGHDTVQSDDLQQKAEELRAWADEIRGTDFDEFEEPDEEPDEDADDVRESWLEDQQAKLADVLSECPV